ncbi:MAG TPA: hypothetical protein VEL07_02925 [Planctomycetota bacterium]|nr:hypothetical protein [Planctomycetota bacterium]
MTSPTRSAITLLEMIVAAAILSSVLTVALQGLSSGTRVSGTMESSMAADNEVSQTVGDITRELRSAIAADAEGFKTDPLTFKVCTGFDTNPASPTFGQATYGDMRSYVFDAAAGTLTKIHSVGEANSWSETIARDVTDFRTYGDDQVYFVEMTTRYSDPDGNLCSRSSKGQIFLRSGLIDPTAYGAAIGSTTGSDTGNEPVDEKPVEEPTGDPTGGDEPPTQQPPVANDPSVTMSLTRSFNGKDVTGTIIASVPSGDEVTDVSLAVSADGWSANTTTSSSPTNYVKTFQITGVKNIAVTVTATAVSKSGGKTTKSQTVAP